MKTTATVIQRNLLNILDDAFFAEGREIIRPGSYPGGSSPSVPVVACESFATAGMLTTDAGFVLELKDGSKFQITIVQRA
jgi:hypothetical protein